MDGVEATKRIRALDPEAKILVLTTFDEDRLVFEAVRSGARGYLLKDISGAETRGRVARRGLGRRRASAGRGAQGHGRVCAAHAGRADAAGRKPAESLSSRKRAVLALVAKGLGNRR